MAAAVVFPPALSQPDYQPRDSVRRRYNTNNIHDVPIANSSNNNRHQDTFNVSPLLSSHPSKSASHMHTSSASRTGRRPNASDASLSNHSTMDVETSTNDMTRIFSELSTTFAPSPPSLRTRVSDPKRKRRRGSQSGSFSALTHSYVDPTAPMPSGTASTRSSSTTSSTPRIRPYLRKLSLTKSKEDAEQGRLDLSKSVSENAALAGLGIADYGLRPSLDLPYSPASAAGHSRTLSGSSQVSVGSSSQSFRANQPFVHPMRQTPRPYTPPAAGSYASSINGEDSDENRTGDLDGAAARDCFRRGPGHRSGRSLSMTVAASQFTGSPLTHMHTVPDLSHGHGLSSEPADHHASSHSTKPSRSRRTLFRRETEPSKSSTDQSTFSARPSRTSIDRSFTFTSRRSSNAAHESHSTDAFPATHEERIQAARRAFEDKEAQKEQKLAERRALKAARSISDQPRRKAGMVEGSRRKSSSLVPTLSSTASVPALRSRASLASLRESSGRRKLSKAPPLPAPLPQQSSTSSHHRTQPPSQSLRSRAYEHSAPAPLPLSTDRNPRSSSTPNLNDEKGHREDGTRVVERGNVVEDEEDLDSRLPASKRTETPQVGWVRFSTWAQTRILGCMT